MKKLSKAQQAVVDRMREGWVLHTTTLLTKKGEHKHFISRATYRALWDKDIIELETGFLTICRLTEQYKTAPEQKKETDAYGDLGRELDNPFNSDRWETFSNL